MKGGRRTRRNERRKNEDEGVTYEAEEGEGEAGRRGEEGTVETRRRRSRRRTKEGDSLSGGNRD